VLPQTHECAIVSVTSLRNSKDHTVILRVGDHPFIRHDSTIFYGDAMIVNARRLQAEIAAGLALVREKRPSTRWHASLRSLTHRKPPIAAAYYRLLPRKLSGGPK
jgi:hypothetical protein